MSLNYTSHDCNCAEPQLGIISHGQAFCSLCDGFLADIDDIDLVPQVIKIPVKYVDDSRTYPDRVGDDYKDSIWEDE